MVPPSQWNRLPFGSPWEVLSRFGMGARCGNYTSHATFQTTVRERSRRTGGSLAKGYPQKSPVAGARKRLAAVLRRGEEPGFGCAGIVREAGSKGYETPHFPIRVTSVVSGPYWPASSPFTSWEGL